MSNWQDSRTTFFILIIYVAFRIHHLQLQNSWNFQLLVPGFIIPRPSICYLIFIWPKSCKLFYHNILNSSQFIMITKCPICVWLSSQALIWIPPEIVLKISWCMSITITCKCLSMHVNACQCMSMHVYACQL